MQDRFRNTCPANASSRILGTLRLDMNNATVKGEHLIFGKGTSRVLEVNVTVRVTMGGVLGVLGWNERGCGHGAVY
jgi:hypothetical protein